MIIVMQPPVSIQPIEHVCHEFRGIAQIVARDI